LDFSKLHLAPTGLTLDAQGTLNPDAAFPIAEQPFDVSAKISVDAQAEAGALLESLGLEALPFSNLTASLKAQQVDGRLQATVANGMIDGIEWSARGTLDQALKRLTIDAELTKLDLDALAGEEAPDSEQPSTDWDEPLWPDEIFETPQLSATLSIGEIIYSGLPITENSIKIVTNAETLSLNFEGHLLGGKLMAASVAHKNSTKANPFSWQATRIDLNQLLAPLTPGQFSGEGEYQFKGSNMRQLVDSLKGRSNFELREAEFDMTAIKSALSTLDGLLNTQSGAETWPDRAQFDQATGHHQATSGLASGQSFSVDLANIHLSGKGGVNLPEGKANLLLDLKVDETTTPPLPVSGPITKVSWPIKCNGDLDAEITELCSPDQDRAKRLAGEILKAKVQDKGRQLLEGLIKGDNKSSIKNLLKW
jgi:AsmA protein